MSNPATLKKIAEALNISVSTVSRALSGHPDIASATKKKVIELSKLLDYEPNQFAVQLKTNNSKIWGIIVPELSNYFYDSFLSAIEEEARILGYSVIVMQSGDDPSIELSNLQFLKKNRVAGLFVSISSGTKEVDAFKRLMAANIPVVFFDRVPVEEDCDKVCFDDVQVAEMIARLIIAKQKKHVLAILWASRLVSTTRKREQAFRAYMQQYGPDISVQFSFQNELEKKTDHILAEARQITRSALMGNNRPDTIFCSGDLTLIGVMEAIQEMELKTPDTIAVISLSNGFIPKLYYPKITHVETSGYKLGKLAYSRIMDYEKGNTQPRELFVESVLVEGQSI